MYSPFYILVSIDDADCGDLSSSLAPCDGHKASAVKFHISCNILNTCYANVIRRKIFNLLLSDFDLGIYEDKINGKLFIPTSLSLEILSSIVEKKLKNFFRGLDIRVRAEFSLDKPSNFETRFQASVAQKKYVYSCSMCQSLFMYHICILTPERMGACGEMTFFDAELMFSLNRFGPCRRIEINNLIDAATGEWEEINKAVYELTFGTISRICLNSASVFPLPCSPLAETISICAGDGEQIYVLDRKDPEESPCGLSFESALEVSQGGFQTPGITCQARKYILSPDFLKAEGGFKNIVWMSGITKKVLNLS